MTLLRKNKTYKLTNLPKIKTNNFQIYGQIGYSGSLVKRLVKNSAGIYHHTGLVYGFDEDDTLWIIENNIYGVECITFRDFHMGKKCVFELNTNSLLIGDIFRRACEKAHDTYDPRKNNCEHFTNYCLTRIHESHQTKNTEVITDFLFSIAELVLINGSPSPTIIDDFTELRKFIELERNETVDKYINQKLEKKKTLKPPVLTVNKLLSKEKGKKNEISTFYSKAYLRHLIISKEMLGAQIASIHNLAFYLWLVKMAREKITDGTFDQWKRVMVKKVSRRL